MNKVSRQELAEVIAERTLHISDHDKLAKSIAAYLAGERRSYDVSSLMRDVQQYRLKAGIVEATAVSAHELTPAVIKDVKDMLKEHFPSARRFIINERIDEDVVGGIRIELPQETLDLSIKSKLNLFKRLVAEERKRA